MRSIVVCLSIALAYVATAAAQNTVLFDNQSGEPALVKLVGPTQTEVQVPNGATAGADAAAGRYIIKVRYGTPDKYLYSKGDEFEVKETSATRSEITITLHKVWGGNYETWPISQAEFGGSQNGPATAKDASARLVPGEAKGELKLAILDTPDAGVSINDIRLVALEKWIPYAGLVEAASSAKVLQLAMTVQATKPRICLGSRSGQRNDEDCLPFSSLLVCTDVEGASVISMAECIGAWGIGKAVAPDGHLNLVNIGEVPFLGSIDVFFSIPENPKKVTFRFSGSPSLVELKMPAEAAQVCQEEETRQAESVTPTPLVTSGTEEIKQGGDLPLYQQVFNHLVRQVRTDAQVEITSNPDTSGLLLILNIVADSEETGERILEMFGQPNSVKEAQTKKFFGRDVPYDVTGTVWEYGPLTLMLKDGKIMYIWIPIDENIVQRGFIPGAEITAPSATPAPSDRDAAVKKLNELATAAEKSGDTKDLLPLRMALYELDMAVQGKQSTEPEESAREKSRALLAKVNPRPRYQQLWKLYSVGFFTFGDVNAVAKGDAEGSKEFSVGLDMWLYCTKHNPVPGLTLYKEDMDLIMAEAEGVVQTLDKGSAFIGRVTLLDKGDLGRQAAILRKALSLKGGSGVRMDFHEGPKGTVVVASPQPRGPR
jgi:hypothetical protein